MGKDIPILVRVISVLIVLSAGYLVYYGGLLYYLNEGILFTILLFVFALYLISLGIGLWIGKTWGRKAVIGMTSIGVILTIVTISQKNLVSNIISIIVGILIVSYLLFNTKVKEAFSKD